jgi:MFS family permease
LDKLKSLVDARAYASLFFSRTIYAVNWYNVAALFTFIAYEFNLNVSGLGIATAAFYAGVGIFQVPGGIVAAKYGARKTAFAGVLTCSIATILSAFAPDFSLFVMLRFFVGLGMAFFFGPGVTLVAKTFRRESEGFGVGTFQSAFYAGGALGLFAWSILAVAAGWRQGLVVSGVLGVIGAVLLILYVPKEESTDGFNVRFSDLRKVLTDRWLVLLSLELFGFGSGTILISTFMTYYVEQSFSLSPSFAGVIGSITPLCAIAASPLVGSLYDRTGNARTLLFSLGVLLAIAIALVGTSSILVAVGSSVLAGICGGSFTVGYLAARNDYSASSEYQSLAVSWVNTIQMLAGFWSPVIFSMLVISIGYSTAWVVGGAYTFFLTSIILLGKGQLNKRQ